MHQLHGYQMLKRVCRNFFLSICYRMFSCCTVCRRYRECSCTVTWSAALEGRPGARGDLAALILQPAPGAGQEGEQTPGPWGQEGEQTTWPWQQEGEQTPGSWGQKGAQTTGPWGQEEEQTPGPWGQEGEQTTGPWGQEGEQTPGLWGQEGEQTTGRFL